jgi:hypothetical protein
MGDAFLSHKKALLADQRTWIGNQPFYRPDGYEVYLQSTGLFG